MSEEKFFQNVKASLYDFAPEVPQSVYSGMRRKLWISNFMTWKWASLNIWYVLLLVGIGTGVAFSSSESSIQADKAQSSPIQTSRMEMPVANATTQNSVAINNDQVTSTPKRRVTHSIDPIVAPDPYNTPVDQFPNPECNLPKVEDPELTTTETSIIENNVVPNPTSAKVEEPLKGKELEVDVYTDGN